MDSSRWPIAPEATGCGVCGSSSSRRWRIAPGHCKVLFLLPLQRPAGSSRWLSAQGFVFSSLPPRMNYYNLSSQDPGQKSSSTHDQGSAACIDLTCKWERILIYTHSTQSKHGHAYNTHSEDARTRMHAHTDNICVFSYSIPSSSARTSSTITPHDFY